MLISIARRSAALRLPGGVVISPRPSDTTVALAVVLASARVRSSRSRLDSSGRSTTTRTGAPRSSPRSWDAPRPGSRLAAAARWSAPRASTACASDPAVATKTLSVPVPVSGPFMILVSAERRQSGGAAPFVSAASPRVSWLRLNSGVVAVDADASPPRTSTTRTHRRFTVRFEPGVPSGFNPGFTLVSLVVTQSSAIVAVASAR
mmetsp:Transcript_7470/g.33708  ORF Transcript_7470/g.33708 Transcript_7470/m.33708 type:complete len:205 (-) Transcript_7470:3770-4384(-)